MIYKMRTHDGVKYHNWFHNAFYAAKTDLGVEGYDISDFKKIYKDAYGYNLDGNINYVEFPSQEEAIMFLLKWQSY